MDVPCLRDCPDRTATCHTECERYRAYAAWREEELAKKAVRVRGRVSSIGAAKAARKKLIRQKQGW